MFAFIRAFLSYKPSVFESTIDRWERKGLLRRINQPSEAQPPDSESRFGQLREAWDDFVNTMLALFERFSAARASTSGSRIPNRWRLRRLHRWQQREQVRAEREGRVLKRETYDELVEGLLR